LGSFFAHSLPPSPNDYVQANKESNRDRLQKLKIKIVDTLKFDERRLRIIYYTSISYIILFERTTVKITLVLKHAISMISIGIGC
jgi:sRNA-binding regulator protein Hfq